MFAHRYPTRRQNIGGTLAFGYRLGELLVPCIRQCRHDLTWGSVQSDMPFHFCHAPLEPGAILKPGNYGRILLAAGYGHSHALRESVIEYVRISDFSNLPSRLSSVFYFENHQRALAYKQNENLRFVHLYEVERIDLDAPEATTDFRRVNPIGTIGLDWARSYWKGDPYPAAGSDPDDFKETFSESRIRVISLVPE